MIICYYLVFRAKFANVSTEYSLLPWWWLKHSVETLVQVFFSELKFVAGITFFLLVSNLLTAGRVSDQICPSAGQLKYWKISWQFHDSAHPSQSHSQTWMAWERGHLRNTYTHEQSTNHISLKNRLCKVTHCAGCILASSAALGWPGDGDCYLMH